MEFKRKFNEYGYEQTKCPLCGEWQYRIKMHLALKKDKTHKDFYYKHSELITRRKEKLNGILFFS